MVPDCRKVVVVEMAKPKTDSMVFLRGGRRGLRGATWAVRAWGEV
jgi:hypothetical protein